MDLHINTYNIIWAIYNRVVWKWKNCCLNFFFLEKWWDYYEFCVLYNRRDTCLSKGKWARQPQYKTLQKIRNETKLEMKRNMKLVDSCRYLEYRQKRKEALTTTLIGNVELAISSSWLGDWWNCFWLHHRCGTQNESNDQLLIPSSSSFLWWADGLCILQHSHVYNVLCLCLLFTVFLLLPTCACRYIHRGVDDGKSQRRWPCLATRQAGVHRHTHRHVGQLLLE